MNVDVCAVLRNGYSSSILDRQMMSEQHHVTEQPDEAEVRPKRILKRHPAMPFLRRFLRGIGVFSTMVVITDALSWHFMDENPLMRLEWIVLTVLLITAFETFLEKFRRGRSAY